VAYKPFDLTGKVALVTGGNGGIGFGMVEAMAQAGADIVIWGSNATKTADAAEKLKATGVRVLPQRVDVPEREAVRARPRRVHGDDVTADQDGVLVHRHGCRSAHALQGGAVQESA